MRGGNWWSRITGQLGDGKQRHELSKTRKAVAVVFASLVLMSLIRRGCLRGRRR